jgi:2-oxo-4-hydroxy-4-carboxy-5-ureidoimidazoline decarboxylase
VAAADERAKLDLICAHPSLAGRAVLTKSSGGEQRSAGLDELSEDEIALFDNYNGQYREKFGFPFVICAKLNKKEAILAAFQVRLQNSAEQEKETALEEIYKIADLRLHEIVE